MSADQRRGFASYDGVDPWTRSSTHHEPSAAVIDPAAWPATYDSAWNALGCPSGDIPSARLQQAFQDAGLSSSTSSKILTLTTSRGRVDRSEFAVAMALAALAQQDKELSIEAVVAQKDHPPEPSLSFGSMGRPRKLSINHASADPWARGGSSSPPATNVAGFATSPSGFGDEPSVMEMGPAAMDREREKVKVELESELSGRYLAKYQQYDVSCQTRGTTVSRRFSDWVWLLGCLERRYIFRLLPTLPPKRVGVNGAHAFADSQFTERRRRGLQRVCNFLANHPILRGDSLVSIFFSEPSDLTLWRKSHPISLEDESMSRRLTSNEEMSVPSDLEDRLATFRSRLPQLIAGWTTLCQTLERIARRREAEAADFARFGGVMDGLVLADTPALIQLEGVDGTERDMRAVSEHAVNYASAVQVRAQAVVLDSLERLKAHRELYSDFGHLLGRHDRFAPDAIDKLTARIETSQKKLETVRREKKKPTWEVEAEGLVSSIEADQVSVEQLTHRRSFIKYAIWQELTLLVRLSTLLEITMRKYASEESSYSARLQQLWSTLVDQLPELSRACPRGARSSVLVAHHARNLARHLALGRPLRFPSSTAPIDEASLIPSVSFASQLVTAASSGLSHALQQPKMPLGQAPRMESCLCAEARGGVFVTGGMVSFHKHVREIMERVQTVGSLEFGAETAIPSVINFSGPQATGQSQSQICYNHAVNETIKHETERMAIARLCTYLWFHRLELTITDDQTWRAKLQIAGLTLATNVGKIEPGKNPDKYRRAVKLLICGRANDGVKVTERMVKDHIKKVAEHLRLEQQQKASASHGSTVPPQTSHASEQRPPLRYDPKNNTYIGWKTRKATGDFNSYLQKAVDLARNRQPQP